MAAPNDVIRGALKLDNFLEGQCFTSWADFIAAVPSMFSVEVPATITNVTVGNTQPDDSQRDNLWVRRDNSGSFLGLYIYGQGAWRQIYPVPNQLTLVYGDSRVIPPGYTLATDSTNLNTAQKTKLVESWHIGGTSPTWYDIFSVVYTGF